MKSIIAILSISLFPFLGFCNTLDSYEDYVMEIPNVEYSREQIQQFCCNLFLVNRINDLENKYEALSIEVQNLRNFLFEEYISHRE